MTEQPTPSSTATTHPGPAGFPGAGSELTDLVETWWEALRSFVALLQGLDPADWRAPTDLPGWDVHAVASHVAHLEALRAGTPHDDVAIGSPAHVRNALGQVTEQGVVARRDRTPDALLEEIRTVSTAHHAALLAAPPTDPDAPAPGIFAQVGWSTRTLLRNRPLDVAMHEQDVRRAVGRPGNLDHRGLVHAADYLAESLGYVLARRVQAPVGTTVRLDVTGHPTRAWRVGADGRGHALPTPPDGADVHLACDREPFLLLAGGRVHGEAGEATRAQVRVEGDADLASRLLAQLAVTP